MILLPGSAGAATIDAYPGWGVQLSQVQLLASGSQGCALDACTYNGAMPASLDAAALRPASTAVPAAGSTSTASLQGMQAGAESSSSSSSSSATCILPDALSGRLLTGSSTSSPAGAQQDHAGSSFAAADLLGDLSMAYATSANLVNVAPLTVQLSTISKGRVSTIDNSTGASLLPGTLQFTL